MAIKVAPVLIDTDSRMSDKAISDSSLSNEYTVLIDGVIEITNDVDTKAFFDGLLDTMLEYIETHQALAALTITHQAYIDVDSEQNANGRTPT